MFSFISHTPCTFYSTFLPAFGMLGDSIFPSIIFEVVSFFFFTILLEVILDIKICFFDLSKFNANWYFYLLL